MKYRQVRYNHKLRAYTVAKELGVDYNKYIEVEKGERPLEQEYVEKFRKIMRDANTIRMNASISIGKAKTELADGTLKKLMEDMGYNQITLAKTMGLRTFHMNAIFCGRSKNEDTIERMYDFLHEPFNRKIEIEPKFEKQKDETQNTPTALVINDDNKALSDMYEIDKKVEIEKQDNERIEILRSACEELTRENEYLKRQIETYIKLVEKI